MRFENMLARRYIFSQKRHSLFTICSIAAALTLMIMLFTGFSTYLGCMRAISYDQAPYHCLIYSVTEEQGEIIADSDGIESCKLMRNPLDDSSYQAYIFFEKGVNDEEKILSKAFESAGIDFSFHLDLLNATFILNKKLMNYDFVGIGAWYEIAQIFALFYVFVIFLAMAMRLVIDTAFEISSKERERQFGMLQSIGASPKQIVRIITIEGMLLSVIGIPLGILCGIGLGYLAFEMILKTGIAETFFTAEKAEELLQFSINPLMILIGAATGLVWVWLSAYGTGMRIVKMSPIQAISSRSNTVKKVKKHSFFGLIFGWAGKLAARNTRRAPKRFIITVVSLTVSITLFASFSFIVDMFSNNFEKYFSNEGINYDFELGTGTNSEDDKFSYQESYRILKESGYFKDISTSVIATGIHSVSSENENVIFYTDYYNKEGYERLFKGKPPVSYDKLSEKGGYILITGSEEHQSNHFKDMENISAVITNRIFLTQEEYDELSPEEVKNVQETSFEDEEKKYILKKEEKVSFDIECSIDDNEITSSYYSNDYVRLISTMTQYENNDYLYYYGDSGHGAWITCNLVNDSDYHSALRLIEDNEEYVELYFDYYTMIRQTRSGIAAVKTAVTFINIMIALIAAVNMINIISTGILNRRSETASMQCVGMTHGQLYRMTVIECLQYVFSSGVVSSALCIIIVYATKRLLAVMELLADNVNLISYSTPVFKVWFAVCVAFAVALVTALISLRKMQKTPLVEQLRSVD